MNFNCEWDKEADRSFVKDTNRTNQSISETESISHYVKQSGDLGFLEYTVILGNEKYEPFS